jgi:hypothetical protein
MEIKINGRRATSSELDEQIRRESSATGSSGPSTRER